MKLFRTASLLLAVFGTLTATPVFAQKLKSPVVPQAKVSAPAAVKLAVQPKFGTSLVTGVFKCNVAKGARNAYFLVITAAEKPTKANPRLRSTKAYLLQVPRTQLRNTKISALQSLSLLNTNAAVSRIRQTVDAAVVAGIRGAVIGELDKARLDALLGGQGIRLAGTSLAANGGTDFVKGVAEVGGAIAAVAGQFGSQVSVSTLIGAGTAAEMGAVGAAAVVVFFGANTAATAVLDATGANSGYTLGDFVYDATHPDEEGNPVYADDDETDDAAPASPGASGSGSSGSEGEAEEDEDQSEEGDGEEEQEEEEEEEEDDSEDDSAGSSGTTLPPDFDLSSAPGKSIDLLIALGLASNKAVGKSIVLRPVSLLGEPILGENSTTPMKVLLYFDAMFGGTFFKTVQRGLVARKNGASTPNPINEQSSGQASLLNMMMVIKGCPLPANVAAFQKFMLGASLSAIQR